MTYTFPPSLYPLRDYLKAQGADTRAFVSARQAAFMSQQLLGTRVKFPDKGADMTSTLFLIQKAVTEKGIATMATPSRDSRDTNTMARRLRKKEGKSLQKRNRTSITMTSAQRSFRKACTSSAMVRQCQILASAAGVLLCSRTALKSLRCTVAIPKPRTIRWSLRAF